MDCKTSDGQRVWLEGMQQSELIALSPSVSLASLLLQLQHSRAGEGRSCKHVGYNVRIHVIEYFAGEKLLQMSKISRKMDQLLHSGKDCVYYVRFAILFLLGDHARKNILVIRYTESQPFNGINR